ncbi:MAG: hypothetical protein QM529_01725 [Hydrotalea sp.]|nr:hypothetical protein [Hydrotalea sp.]
MKELIKKYLLSPLAIALIGVIIAFTNFAHDTFRSANKDWFKDFNLDSEIHILGKIVADRFDIPITGNQNLFAFDSHEKTYDYDKFWKNRDRDKVAVYDDLFGGGKIVTMSPAEARQRIVMSGNYTSQFVLQGKIYSYLFNNLGITDIKIFYAINSLLLAVIIVLLSFLFWRAIDKPFAIIFYLSMVFSPWVVVFAKHLYWTTWAMYLPAVFGLLYYLEKRHPWRGWLWLALLFLSFTLRSLMLYEFISAVILFAGAIFFIDMFKVKPRYGRAESLVGFITICGLGVAGFLVALFIHAAQNWNGNGLIENLIGIYQEHVARRTYGGSTGIDTPIHLIDVFKRYMGWHSWPDTPMEQVTKLFYLSGGVLFRLLMITSILQSVYYFYKKNKYRWERASMLFIFMATGLSWMMLAKNHSFIHSNFVFILWYFGAVTILFYLFYKLFSDIAPVAIKKSDKKFGKKSWLKTINRP